jgi:hypothetical protein
MAKVIYSKKESSLIPNSQLESMFLSICTDEQMQEYQKLIEKELVATASAYASHKVTRTFQHLRDNFIKQGGDLEYLQYFLWRKHK